jgi:hypothetical protein
MAKDTSRCPYCLVFYFEHPQEPCEGMLKSQQSKIATTKMVEDSMMDAKRKIELYDGAVARLENFSFAQANPNFFMGPLYVSGYDAAIKDVLKLLKEGYKDTTETSNVIS